MGKRRTEGGSAGLRRIGDLGRFFDPLMQRMVARNVGKDYERLKELLDSGASA